MRPFRTPARTRHWQDRPHVERHRFSTPSPWKRAANVTEPALWGARRQPAPMAVGGRLAARLTRWHSPSRSDDEGPFSHLFDSGGGRRSGELGASALPGSWETLRWLVLPTGATGLLLFLTALLSVVAERGNRNLPLGEQVQALRDHPLLGLGTLVCFAALGVATVRGFFGPGAPVEELGIRYFDDHGVRTLATAEQWMRAHAWLFILGCAFGALGAYTARSLFDVLDRQLEVEALRGSVGAATSEVLGCPHPAFGGSRRPADDKARRRRPRSRSSPSAAPTTWHRVPQGPRSEYRNASHRVRRTARSLSRR